MSRAAELTKEFCSKYMERSVINPETGEESSISTITYKELIQNLKKANITHFEILQDLLDIVMAHLVVGLSVYWDGGGPEIFNNHLQSGAGKDLTEIIKNILEAQAMMSPDSSFSLKTKP